MLDLSDLFRAALGAGEGESTLAEEVDAGRALPRRSSSCAWASACRCAGSATEPLPWSLPMPRLVLQPLLENAVLHGISRLPEGGAIDDRAARATRRRAARSRVRNPAPPPRERDAAAAAPATPRRSIAPAPGAMHFGPRARMTRALARGLLCVPIRCRWPMPSRRT